jgi:DNA end-binding protein Ku
MARALQSASLTFGLVNIPVKLYTATSSKSVAFHMLHAKDKSRIRQHLYCETENKEVSREDIVKGYEVRKGRYVALTDEELEAMEASANRNVEIQEFVPLEAIDPVYFEKTYYLGPDKGGEKPYGLLAQALNESKRGAVAQFVMRGKEHLVMIRPVDEAHLALDVLYYADEVREVTELNVRQAKLKEGELKLAEQLIDGLSHDTWRPEKYHDRYRERVLALIKKKGKGLDVAVQRPVGGQAEVIDLMEALKKSLAGGMRSKEKRSAARSQHKDSRRRVHARDRWGSVKD